MPRPARISLPGVYHVISRGNNREKVFRDEIDREKYLRLLRLYKRERPFYLYAYCLMSNHVHLLIETKEEGALSKIMQRVTLAYAKWFKARYSWVGHLWQDRFRSYVVDKERYLWACIRYIALNPVEAGMVSKPEAYPWSSYRYLFEREKDTLIDWQNLDRLLEIRNSNDDLNAYRQEVLKELCQQGPLIKTF